MNSTRPDSPLLAAALAAVEDGATASDIEGRLADAGARLDGQTAERLLGDLARLGLVRVARGTGEGRCYVVTSIGQRRRDDCRYGEGAEAERLIELERLRTDLLSTIAHELRTPLTAVRTSVGLLQDPEHEPDPGQRETLLATIGRNAERMQRLVADILELARFRSGTVQLQLRRFDARRMAEAALASIAPLAAAAGQRLTLDAATGPVWVYGDHRRLEQGLINLLSNAQKFSPPDAEVSLRVERIGPDVHWTVVDHGPGIDVDDRARLFERFFVGRNDRGGRASGVGLGLPTALAIAQAHGGRVDVHSRAGEGSTFVLGVPPAGPELEDNA